MDPGVGAAGTDEIDGGAEVVERPRVHVARLEADDERPVAGRQALGKAVEEEAALTVGVGDDGPGAAKAQVLERGADRRVGLRSHQDVDRRRARQPVGLHVPAPVGEHPVARRREAGDVGHLAARREPEAGPVREPEEVDQPGAHHLLDDRCRRPRDVDARVLVPGAGQPVGGERGRQRSPDHEPEVARPRHADDAGLRLPGEVLQDRRWRPRRPPATGRRDPRAAPPGWRTRAPGARPASPGSRRRCPPCGEGGPRCRRWTETAPDRDASPLLSCGFESREHRATGPACRVVTRSEDASAGTMVAPRPGRPRWHTRPSCSSAPWTPRASSSRTSGT